MLPLLLLACGMALPAPQRTVNHGAVRVFVDHDAVCWLRSETGLSCLPCAQVPEACAATRALGTEPAK